MLLLTKLGLLVISQSLERIRLIKVCREFFLKPNLQIPGNVSHVCPSFHGLYAIPVQDGAVNHTQGFTDAAATDDAHKLTTLTSKGMAGVAVRILIDEDFANEVKDLFDKGKKGKEVN